MLCDNVVLPPPPGVSPVLARPMFSLWFEFRENAQTGKTAMLFLCYAN